ncbi:hypothetical protein, partial [Thomasclavelia cocleata]
SEKQEIYEKGLAEGEIKGFAKGALKENIDLIEARYGIRDDEWVSSLNIKQLKEIKKIIFEEVVYEKFKQRIEEIHE